MTSKFSIDNRELLQRISSGEAVVGIDFGNLIIRELAAFRLAAMDSEPVAFIARYESGAIHGTCDRDDPAKMEWLKRGMDVSPLYAAPQLPQPAVVSEKIIDNFEEEFRRAFVVSAAVEQLIEISYQGDKFSLSIRDAATLWKLGRAAMPAAAPQSPGSEPATVPGKWIPVSEQKPDCWCLTCRPVTLNDMRFVVCPDCGNKRCPRANDHRNACARSNEPGQEGSAYPAAPQEVRGE